MVQIKVLEWKIHECFNDIEISKFKKNHYYFLTRKASWLFILSMRIPRAFLDTVMRGDYQMIRWRNR